MTAQTTDSESVRFVVSSMPKPVIRQALLVIPVVVDLALITAVSGTGSLQGFYLAGVLVLMAATGVAFAESRRPVPAWLVASIPVVDLVAIGLMRLVPGGNGLGVLAVLPAMWLAADHKMRGVALSLVGTVVLVSVPSLLYFGAETAWWSRAVLVPLVATMVALTVAGTAQVWLRQNQELERQGQRLQEALEEVTASRALNEAIISTVQVGLVALDRNGDYVLVNPRQREYLELAFPGGHQGQAGQLGEVYAADRATRLAEEDMPSARAMRGEEFVDFVLWIGKEAERQKALSVSSAPIKLDGEVDGALLVYKDITDLMSALKVKDDFVASVSHELRTPLTSIMGFLDLVLDDEDSVTPGVRQQLNIVKRNSERLLRLVSDLLFTAQVEEGGQMALTLRPTDLAAMVRQAVADLAPRAAEEGIVLTQDIPTSAILVLDPLRVRQTVDNLVSNAIKYSSPGDTVSVRLHRDGDELTLTVTDTGIGIAAGDLERVFTRFFRSEDAHARAIQGVGLGLAITKSIVEAHGGSIDVSSTPGLGSTFTVRLPTKPLVAAGLRLPVGPVDPVEEDVAV